MIFAYELNIKSDVIELKKFLSLSDNVYEVMNVRRLYVNNLH